MEVTIREYSDADAAGVAAMWNESNKGWPGGFLGFIELTERRIREKMRQRDYVSVFLALVGKKVVGYCSVNEHSDDPNVAYVELLNVHPKYHGRKIGKRLLLAAVEKSIERGYDRLDLHTWPGNIKAVPLYKKTGFFWVPKTQVYMQNFIPLVFQNPIARRFFESANWYSAQVRDLSVEPDQWLFQTHLKAPSDLSGHGRSQEKQDPLFFLFWIDHNGAGPRREKENSLKNGLDPLVPFGIYCRAMLNQDKLWYVKNELKP